LILESDGRVMIWWHIDPRLTRTFGDAPGRKL
jgi:hypothetical protein